MGESPLCCLGFASSRCCEDTFVKKNSPQSRSILKLLDLFSELPQRIKTSRSIFRNGSCLPFPILQNRSKNRQPVLKNMIGKNTQNRQSTRTSKIEHEVQVIQKAEKQSV